MQRRVSFLLALLLAASSAFSEPASRVVLVRDTGSVKGMSVDAAKVHAMVATGMKTLTGQTDETAAWRQLFDSHDVVGIKVSTMAAPLHVTHEEVIEAIVAGLRSAGVAATNVIVFDRFPKKITEAEYRTNAFRAVAIIGGTGWDADAFIENRAVGKLIWGDLLFGQEEELSTRSHLPLLVTHTITKLINVPVLMDHDTAGIANCLYNISLGMADNTRRFEQAGQRGDVAIPELCLAPALRGKLVLNICDGLIGGFAGGPFFKPQYAWPYAGLFFSRDPVAIDALCLDLLEARRKEEKVPAIGPRAIHIATAARAGIGQCERKQIELLEVP